MYMVTLTTKTIDCKVFLYVSISPGLMHILGYISEQVSCYSILSCFFGLFFFIFLLYGIKGALFCQLSWNKAFAERKEMV